MKIIVASQNPVKIETTRLGFSRMFPDEVLDISGVSVPSNVPDQPKGDEVLTGAINRAENASKISVDADFWVGIEGGIDDDGQDMNTFAWIVIKAKNGKMGKGSTGKFFLPKKVAKLIRQGKELGEADDIVFGLKNSKQANGAVGILTGNVLTRTTFYENAVILALIPFKNHDLY